MRILDRYILREFLLPFLYCIITFVLLYIIVDLFNHIDEILKQNVPFSVLLHYYCSAIPVIFVQTVPIAVLLSTIYLLGTLNRHNEIIAMKTNGISLFKILRPFLFMGLLISLITFIVNEKIVPNVSAISTKIKEEKIEKNKEKQSKLISNIAIYGTRNRLIHAGTYDPVSKTLHDIVILEHGPNQKVTSKINAKSAKWINKKWESYDVIIYKFDEEGKMTGEPSVFKDKLLDIDEKPQDFLRAEVRTEFMNYRQLKKYIKRLSGSGNKTIRKLLVDLHYKISFPFISFIIILIGIPFALVTSRGGPLFSIGICIGISLSWESARHFR